MRVVVARALRAHALERARGDRSTKTVVVARGLRRRSSAIEATPSASGGGGGGGWASGLRRAAGDERDDDDRDAYEDDGRASRSRASAREGRTSAGGFGEGREEWRGRSDGDDGARRRRSRPTGDRARSRGRRDQRHGAQSYGRGGRRDDAREGARGRDREAAREDEAPKPVRAGHRRFYATCHPGLEDVVARELASPMINASDIVIGKSGVSFTGTQRVGYDANVWLRSAVRVLVELKRGYLDPYVSGTQSVYEFVKHAVPWEEVIPGGERGDGLKFGVETRLWDCSQITSSHAAKIRVKDAVCDALVDATGTRPSPPDNYAAADVPLYVTLYRDEIIMYRDMSGESLHRRGYRNAMHRASLSESAAAGMLSLAGWPDMLEEWQRDPAGSPPPVLIDPMCGSGTFLIEGALMAANVAPGLIRSETIGYAFERWPDHNPRTFEECLENARRIGAETRTAAPTPPVIIGNDIHPGAVTLAGQGSETARVAGMIDVFRNDCEMFNITASSAGAKIAPNAPKLVVTNPPWGKRIGAGEPAGRRRAGPGDYDDEYGDEDSFDRDTTVGSNDISAEEALEQVWNSLGVFLKRECPDSSAFVLSGNPEVSRAIRMRASRKHVVGIGGVDCRLLRYDILPPKPPGYAPRQRLEERD